MIFKKSSSDDKYSGYNATTAYAKWQNVSLEEAFRTDIWEYMGHLIEAVDNLEKKLNVKNT